jgi:hypothetical protein
LEEKEKEKPLYLHVPLLENAASLISSISFEDREKSFLLLMAIKTYLVYFFFQIFSFPAGL